MPVMLIMAAHLITLMYLIPLFNPKIVNIPEIATSFWRKLFIVLLIVNDCLLYTSPSPRDRG